MKSLLIILSLALSPALLTAQTWASDWDTISINQNPVPGEALVSFSIGYPKGWDAYENPAAARQDIYNDITYSDPGYGSICSFTPRNKAGSLKSFGCACYAVWLSRGSSAKEAMESFLSSKTAESRSRVKTGAGDSGWLVETMGVIRFHPTVITSSVDFLKLEKDNSQSEIIPVIYHDFFFRSESSRGNKEPIHIEIMTRASDSFSRSELDHLVLKTLRFSDTR